jgi:hypothetical protein
MIGNTQNAIPKASLTFSSYMLYAITGSAIASFFLVACASVPPPSQQIAAAEMAIAHAEQAQVADYSSPELVDAREKLTAARAAVAEKNMTTAARLAEQAELNADLASAKATAAKAKTVNDEMQKSTSVIKQEMQRNPGVQ